MSVDERAIRDLVARWMEASKNGDTSAVLELMADDALFMVPGQEPFGPEAFRTASEGASKARIEGRSDVRELQICGEWAFLRAYIEIAVTPPGASKPVCRAGWTLTILRKGADGRWRLYRDANLLTVRPTRPDLQEVSAT